MPDDLSGWTLQPAATQDVSSWTLEPATPPAKAPEPQPRKPMSLPKAMLKGVQDLPTFGFGDELGGATQAAMATGASYFPNAMKKLGVERPEEIGDPRVVYRQARDAMRDESKQARKDHPVGYYGAGLAASLPVAALTSPFEAAQGASLGARVLAGVGNGAAAGVLSGAGNSESDSAAGTAGDALAGGLFGGTVGAAFPLAGAGFNALYGGVVTPTAAAQLLRSKGIPLTVGQMNPEGKLAQLEEASQSVGGVGPVIAGQRAAGVGGWQKAVLNEARAPNSAPLPSGNPSEQLDAAYQSYKPAYDSIRREMVPTSTPEGVPLLGSPPKPPAPASSILDASGAPLRPQGAATPAAAGAFDRVVSDPRVPATDQTRAIVRNFLDDQLTQLPKTPKVEAGALLKMRSAIREAGQDALKQGDFDRARLLGNAEDEVTGALESGLSNEAKASLRSTDQQYSKFKVASDAVRRSGDSAGGFTPSQLSGAIRAQAEKGAYARGGGGPLRELAQAGREVFDARSPATGHRMLTVGPLGWVTGPAMALANTKAVQPLLLGESEKQLAAKAMIEALRNKGITQLGTKAIPAVRNAGITLGNENDLGTMEAALLAAGHFGGH